MTACLFRFIQRHARFLVCLLLFCNLGLASTFFSPGGSLVDSLWVFTAAGLYLTVAALVCCIPDAPDSTNEQPAAPDGDLFARRKCRRLEDEIKRLERGRASLERWNDVLRRKLRQRAEQDDSDEADWWKRGEDSPI